MRQFQAVFGILFIGYHLLFSQNYPTYPVGQSWLFPDARSLALGGAGSVSLAAPGAVLYNPAALTQLEHTVGLDFSLNLRQLDERRSYPLYDRFDGFLVYSTYALNANWYAQPQGGLAVRLPISPDSPLVLAGGIYPEIDYQYQYLEEVRENVFGDQLLAYNRIEAGGVLRRFSLALAAGIPGLNRLSVGIQTGILQGSTDYIQSVKYYTTQQEQILSDQARDLQNTPWLLSVGATYDASERITLGTDVNLPYTVKYAQSSPQGQSDQEQIEYPLRVNGGFEFRARQELQARLNVDIGYEFWSATQYTSDIGGNVPTTLDFSDVFYFKSGIEHIFFNKMPFRVGMQYRTQYLSRGTTQTLLGVGGGFIGDSWRMDIGGAFSKASYRWTDLFDDRLYVSDPNFQGRVDLDSVDESYFFVLISLKYFINLK